MPVSDQASGRGGRTPTVRGCRDTGVTINNQPPAELQLRIEPIDGSPAFEGEKRVTVPRINPPRPGERYPVWFDRADRTVFAIGLAPGESPTPEVRGLFELAQHGDAARPSEPAGQVPGEDPLNRLMKLNELRLAGALSEAEFADLKARIMKDAE
ncbi:MAG: hypothetical protein FWJ93_01385 [Micromonosporaceae bacterium]